MYEDVLTVENPKWMHFLCSGWKNKLLINALSYQKHKWRK